MLGKKENKSPAFQFYARDFLADMKVQLMSMEQRGMYITLLSYAWIENGIPNDPNKIKILCNNPANFDEVIADVLDCFKEKDGRLYNARMESVRSEQLERREKASMAGKKGADARWNGKAIATPLQSHNTATATATATANKIPYEKIVNEYNNALGKNLHMVQKLNSARRLLIKRIWTSNPKLEYFTDYYKKVRNIPFLLGDNNNGWKADFDFLHKEKTIIKVEEGSYVSSSVQKSEYKEPPKQKYIYTCPNHMDQKVESTNPKLFTYCRICKNQMVALSELEYKQAVSKASKAM